MDKKKGERETEWWRMQRKKDELPDALSSGHKIRYGRTGTGTGQNIPSEKNQQRSKEKENKDKVFGGRGGK